MATATTVREWSRTVVEVCPYYGSNHNQEVRRVHYLTHNPPCVSARRDGCRGDGRLHDSAYDVTAKSWSDQIAPGSIQTKTDPYAVKTADNRYHIVYVGTDGYVHDDFEDPSTKAWTDLIPSGSVKALPTVPTWWDSSRRQAVASCATSSGTRPWPWCAVPP